METEHSKAIRQQLQNPREFLKSSGFLIAHYLGDSCAEITTEKEYCEYDGAELDEAMECPECLQLIIENAAFRTGHSQNPTATTTLIRRVKGFENFGVR